MSKRVSSKIIDFKKPEHGKNVVTLSNYEMQKQLYLKAAKPTPKEMNKKITSVGAWFSTHMDCDYYMLLCKELSDYTVFHFNNMNYEKGMRELEEVLESRGIIKDIRYNAASDAYECWIEKDEEIHMYLFFMYDWGIVEIE